MSAPAADPSESSRREPWPSPKRTRRGGDDPPRPDRRVAENYPPLRIEFADLRQRCLFRANFTPPACVGGRKEAEPIMSTEGRGVQSIEVGGRILQVLVDAEQPMMLRDLARQAGVLPAQ